VALEPSPIGYSGLGNDIRDAPLDRRLGDSPVDVKVSGVTSGLRRDVLAFCPVPTTSIGLCPFRVRVPNRSELCCAVDPETHFPS
jgi:hypothetical protein